MNETHASIAKPAKSPSRPRQSRRPTKQTESFPVFCRLAPRACKDLQGQRGLLYVDRKGGKVIEVQFDPEDDGIQSASIYPGAFMQATDLAEQEAIAMVAPDGPWKFVIEWDAEASGTDAIEGEIVSAKPKGHLRLLPSVTE